MKPKYCLTILLLTTGFAYGQGTLIYDQQSTNLVEGSAGLYEAYQPVGQSFTPSLSSISFVELRLYDAGSLEILGSTVYVNLRSDSITGPILSSSTPVFLPNAFFDVTNFFFSTSVSLTPGVTYYLQPVIESGDTVGSYVTDASYPGGSEIYQGVPIADRSLWFREGIVVPEPSSALLILLGGGVLVWRIREKRRR